MYTNRCFLKSRLKQNVQYSNKPRKRQILKNLANDNGCIHFIYHMKSEVFHPKSTQLKYLVTQKFITF